MTFPTLSNRANIALRDEGIETVEQLAALTDHQLRCIHGLGPKGLSEVRALLAKHGKFTNTKGNDRG